MNFANPLALLWALLAIPIVILYILKIRRRHVPVSTILFWQQIFEEKRPRSIWQRLRHPLSLLMQLAFLMLLVFALSEPYREQEIREARRIVLVIDNSASMSAKDSEATRLEQAKTQARRIIAGLRFRDTLAIVAAGGSPRVLCGLTGHQRTLRDVIDAVAPSDAPTRINEAIELGRRLLADEKPAANAVRETASRVIAITDGCFDEAGSLSQAADVQLVLVGKPVDNVGITQFQARRSLVDPVGYEILAEVVNAGEQPVECRLEIDLDGDVLDVFPLKLAPEQIWSNVFTKTSAEGGRLTATLNRADALSADNRAWALLPRRAPQKITLVTSGQWFLRKVFEAMPLVELTVTDKPPASPAPDEIVILHRVAPEALPPGNYLVVEPTTACDLWDVGDMLQNPYAGKQDAASPLLAHVRLDNVLLPAARKIMPKAKLQTLVESLNGELLYATLEDKGRRVLLLTVDVDQGDLPLRTVFPILMTNALRWFAGHAGELREAVTAGTVMDIELPKPLLEASARPAGTNGDVFHSLELTAPNGITRAVASHSDKALIGPLLNCGLWTLRPAASMSPAAPAHLAAPIRPGEADASVSAENSPASQVAKKNAVSESDTLEIACNLANRSESNLRRRGELREAPETKLSGFAAQPIWAYLILGAWLLTTIEWVLYQRRWID